MPVDFGGACERHNYLFNCVLTLLFLSVVACESVWKGPPRRLDFSELGQADRIQVCGRFCDASKDLIIRDANKIHVATAFIDNYRDGWRDSWNGPAGGALNLYFYQGDRVLGGYGMTPVDTAEVLMSVGGGSRKVPAAEMSILMQRLGLSWPPLASIG